MLPRSGGRVVTDWSQLRQTALTGGAQAHEVMNATAAVGSTATRLPGAADRTPRSLWVIRAAGLFQVVSGVLFWTGNAYPLIPFHMLSGLILVITLWVIAVKASRRGASWLAAAGAIVWGLFVVVLGVMQGAILQGDLHWMVQVAHLVVGMAAVGMAHGLARAAAHALVTRGQST